MKDSSGICKYLSDLSYVKLCVRLLFQFILIELRQCVANCFKYIGLSCSCIIDCTQCCRGGSLMLVSFVAA